MLFNNLLKRLGIFQLRTPFKLFSRGIFNSAGALGDDTYIGKSSPIQVGSENWKKLAAGYNHSLAIKSDGTLWGWGDNTYGPVGNGYPLTQLYSWSHISSGSQNVIAIRSDGLLFGWGRNTSHLNIGVSASISPIQIGTASWIHAKTSGFHHYAIKTDGTMWSWGESYNYQNGDGTTNLYTSPIQIGIGASWTQIEASTNPVVLALRTDGTLWGWGKNDYGHLPQVISTTTPSSWIQISCGSHANNINGIGIKSDGTLWSWGENGSSQLGHGSFTDSHTKSPIQVSVGSSFISAIIDRANGFAIRSDGMLFGWGTGGLVGDGTTTQRSVPVQIGTSSWSQVSGGKSHTVGITSDGRLFAWGTNGNGQLGDGTTESRSSPVQVGLGFSWNQVSAGSNHTLAIRQDGLLFAWGKNTNGRYELGDGTYVNKSSPIQIGTFSWNHVSAGELKSAAIRSDGMLFSWGESNLVGDGTGFAKSVPVLISTSNWSKISASGLYHSMGITVDGKLFGWGINNSGQIGDETTTFRISPVQIGTSSWNQVSTGTFHSMMIKTDNTLWASGNNGIFNYSAFGNCGTVATSFPVLVGNGEIEYPRLVSIPTQIGTDTWNDISIDFYTAGGIRSDGKLFTWGRNEQTQIGDNTTGTLSNEGKSSPIQIGTSNWSHLSLGTNHALAIRSDGMLFGWGLNGNGQLGQGNYATRASPTAIGTSSWSQINAGGASSHAIRSDGLLFAWGSNYYGQLGDGSLTDRLSPVQIGALSWNKLGRHKSLMHSFIRQDGILYTTGWNNWGELGNNDGAINTSDNQSSPVSVGANPYLVINSPIQIGVSSWSQVSANRSHSAAIRSDGMLFTWGWNVSKQLGNGSINKKNSNPTAVGTSSWSQVSVGLDHTLAIRSDGLLFAWGNNSYGQLGDGTTTLKSSPIQIGTSSWSQVSAGEQYTIAIRSDKLMFAWGHNLYGQLGDGSSVSKNSPVQIGTSSWKQVGTSAFVSTAIDDYNRLFTWGQGGFQLGTPSYIARASPVQVGTSLWLKFATCAGTTVAIDVKGDLYGWGFNGGTYSLINNNFSLPTFSGVKLCYDVSLGGTPHILFGQKP